MDWVELVDSESSKVVGLVAASVRVMLPNRDEASTIGVDTVNGAMVL
jgi:hypothetical protein